MAGSFVLGLDLGQSSDFTALTVCELTHAPDPGSGRKLGHHAVRFLRRWPQKTAYTAIVRDLEKLLELGPLQRGRLVVDGTGVGAAVVEMFREAKLGAALTSVLITAGHQVTRAEDGVWHVAKKELVSTLQTLLQTGRLKIANLPERPLLLKEMQLFRVKVTAAAHETFEAWRDRDHDDMVLATALACWAGERFGGPWEAPVDADPRRTSEVAKLPDGVFLPEHLKPANWGHL
jgi:hypothetical protein